jgi:hypothetical protein
MKHSQLATFLLLILLAAGCAGITEIAPTQEIVPGSTETAPTVTATLATTLSPMPRNAETLIAEFRLTSIVQAKTPSKTPSPTIFVPSQTPTLTPTITPTFDFSRFQTNTLAPAARCPQVQPGAAPTPDFYDPENFYVDANDVLLYLNTYGPESLIAFFQKAEGPYWDSYIQGYADYTNDGVRELAFGWGNFYIFSCQDGKYVLLYMMEPDGYLSSPDIIRILDANRNGTSELSLLTGFATQGGHGYKVVEWDGSQFRTVLDEIWVYFTGQFGSEDIDRDGYSEYVVYPGIGAMTSYHDTIPWREEKIYFRWNGKEFVEYKYVFTSPEYRFQAVQDGDRALVYGEIDRALNFYRQVIYNLQLGWWSYERELYFYEVYWATWSNNAPTPIPPTPDPGEYDNLAAYARFKLMVTYASRGWHADAKIIFDNIQRRYPEDKVGYHYAELASIFWNEYEPSRSIAAGCQAANVFASSHEKEILYYIQGAGRYASNRINYVDEPEYICPVW